VAKVFKPFLDFGCFREDFDASGAEFVLTSRELDLTLPGLHTVFALDEMDLVFLLLFFFLLVKSPLLQVSDGVVQLQTLI
jgi:hypothetical protein